MFLLIPETCFKRKKTVFTSNHKLTENSDLLCQNMFMILLLSVAVCPRAFVLKF